MERREGMFHWMTCRRATPLTTPLFRPRGHGAAFGPPRNCHDLAGTAIGRNSLSRLERTGQLADAVRVTARYRFCSMEVAHR